MWSCLPLRGEHNSESASTIDRVIPPLIGAFVCSGFFKPKWILVTKSAKLLKSATEKRDPKKHLSLAICDQKHANRNLRPKVGVSVVV